MKKNIYNLSHHKGPGIARFESPPFISNGKENIIESDNKRDSQEFEIWSERSENRVTEHRNSSAEIENSKNLYADIFDLLPTGNLILDSAASILNANYTAAELLGEKKSNLDGEKLSRFIPTEEKSKFDRYYKHASKSLNNRTCELRLIRKDGSSFYAMLSGRLLKNIAKRNQAILLSLVEITDRVLAANKIKDHERFQENIFDAIQDGISVLDRDLTILKVNSTMQKWYPHSVPLEGKKCFEVFHGKRRPCTTCPSRRSLTRQILQKDIVPWVVDGEKRGWLELFAFPIIGPTGEPTGVVEHVRNVTDRIHAEQALKESEQKFRTMVDYTYSWEYWIDPAGNFVYMTPSCQRSTGYKPDDFYNNVDLLKDLVHPEDRKFFDEHLQEEISSNKLVSIDFRLFDRNGDQHWISHNCQPVFTKDGDYIGRRISNRDITIHKNSEVSLHKSSQQLEMQVLNRTKELQLIADQMKDREKDLLRHKSKLEKVNKELLDTNKAVAVLARNIERNRMDTELDITHKITSKIIPLLNDLKTTNSIENVKSGLNILSTHIKALTNGPRLDADKLSKLTMTEIKISSLIKNGYASNEIANKLHLSLHTVKTHRRNIRKKLKIKNLNVNLASYLKTMMP